MATDEKRHNGPTGAANPTGTTITPAAPSQAATGEISGAHEASETDSSAAPSKTARQKIADWLWWGVPSSTDQEAKARTEQLLDAFAVEVLREGADALDRVADEAEARVAAHYGPTSGIGPGSADLVCEAARMLRSATVGRLGQPPAAATPAFFRPGHSYTRQHHGDTIRFFVEYVSTSPDGRSRAAHGWRTRDWHTRWEPTDSDDFTGWTDVTTVYPVGGENAQETTA